MTIVHEEGARVPCAELVCTNRKVHDDVNMRDSSQGAPPPLTDDQRKVMARMIALLDTKEDSVVITNPLAPGGPIVHVTDAWQRMCGYSADEAIGRNPRLTQGEGTCSATAHSIGVALRQQRGCRVRVVNYRGCDGTPFWNCFSVSPVFVDGKLQLFAARLEDYSLHLTQLVSHIPLQFVKAEHDQCAMRLCTAHTAAVLKRPRRLDAVADGSIVEVAADKNALALPSRKVKRLAFDRLALEPEYLCDRLRDEFEQMGVQCRETARYVEGGELMRLDVCLPPTAAAGPNGLRAMLHVLPVSDEGEYSISFTRQSGDTFAFHAFFRDVRTRLADILKPADAAA